jgi:hypothetical protein
MKVTMAKKLNFTLCAVLVIVASCSLLVSDQSVFTEPALLGLFGLGLTGASPFLRRKNHPPGPHPIVLPGPLSR